MSQKQIKKNQMKSHDIQSNLPAGSSIWQWLLIQKDFQKALSRQGFYNIQKIELMRGYREWREDYAPAYKGAAASVSFGAPIDRRSQTPHELSNRDLFIVNGGRSSIFVFDSHQFFEPYMTLHKYSGSAKRLRTEFSSLENYLPHIVEAFRSQWNEATFLKALHFCGAFSALTEKICGELDYCSGPSGSLPIKFPFWMRSRSHVKGGKQFESFVYDGMVDLDDCIYPITKGKKHIAMPVEAKATHIQDLAWHKLAFPSNRFVVQRDENVFFYRTGNGGSRVRIDSSDGNEANAIVPVYCAADPYERAAFIYVFGELESSSGPLDHERRGARGFVLNDPRALVPDQVYKVDLSWIYNE